MNRVFKAGGAAIIAAFLVIISCVIPVTNASTVNILQPVYTWAVGYVGNNGQWYPNDYLDYGMRTSQYTPVNYGTQYHGRYTGVDFDRLIQTYVNEYDSSGNFLGRIRSNSITFDYTPSPNTASISLTIRTYDSQYVDVSLSYDTEQVNFPTGQEQIIDEVHYGSDGDFYVTGNEKALIYYKYLPYDKELIKTIRIEAVNNYGKRLKFRIVGYVHGTEVFRSGLAEYGEDIDIQDANFDYYQIYLVNEDIDGTPIPTEYIQSFRYIYGLRYYIEYPTDPQGVPEDIVPTDYIDLSQFDNVQFPTTPDITDYSKGLNLISSNINSLLSVFPFYTMFAGIAVIIWLLWVASRNGGD